MNGLKLPDTFVALIDRPKPLGWWIPKGGSEAWIYKGGEGGLYWVREGTPDHHDCFELLLRLYERQGWIQEATDALPDAFHIAEYTPEEIADWNAEWSNQPGFTPFITDFSRIVQFGEAGDGAAYCFDYRESQAEPSITHWNDAYWRRFAPNFNMFISWFEPSDGA